MHSRSPRVTVIIPAYNYARFLPMAIRSVLGQSCPDWELVIVDDGSTDNTAEVVQPFLKSDARVRYVHQKNAGLSAARNTGIRHAHTPFVALLDADDEWEPAFLERGLEAFQRLPAEFGLVATASCLMDAAGQLLPASDRGTKSEREIRAEELILKNRFHASSPLIRREVFETCGMFDESLRSSEDRDMWIRVARRFRIQLRPEVLVRARRHGDNMSANCDRMRENIRKMLEKARAGQGGEPRRLFWRRVTAYDRVQSAWMLYGNGRRWEAMQSILVSLLLWPFFLHPAAVGEPVLFRVRSLARFALRPPPGRKPPGIQSPARVAGSGAK